MTAQAAFYNQVMESMELMTDQILALRAISGMLAAIQSNPITLNELCYLLDPIIDKQKALVDELMSIRDVGRIASPPSAPPASSIGDKP